MKQIIQMFVVAMTLLFAVVTTSKAQDFSGVFEEGVELDSTQTYSSHYTVGEDFEMVRVMLNFTVPDEWVPYHLLVDEKVTILFLMPEEDFTLESLVTAMETWDKTGIPEGGIVVLSDPKKRNQEMKVYTFEEGETFIFLKDKNGKTVLYSLGNVQFH
jgi:hypothetical protein